MKFSKIFVPIFLSVTLCACNQPQQDAYILQPITIQNDIPQSVAKKDTTTVKQKEPVAESSTITKPTEEPTTPPTPNNKKNNSNSASSNNSAVKDVIIDGNGNLVVAHANGTFSSFQPLKGEKGDIGAKGDKGDKGADGRGIDHCELDTDKNLIVYYTDGTSQNVGCVAVAPETPQNEIIGYELKHSFGNSYVVSSPQISEPKKVQISNLQGVLSNINDNDISKKYEYTITFNYHVISELSDVSYYSLGISCDYGAGKLATPFTQIDGQETITIYYSMPLTNIISLTYNY